MLKEARIVMPQFSTAVSIDAHQKMRHALIDTFGGYTATNGVGGWRSPDGEIVNDGVIIYDVAINAHRDRHWDTLFNIAMEAGRALQQQSVYIRYPDGTVHIEPVPPVAVPQEKQDVLLRALGAQTKETFAKGAERLLRDIFPDAEVVVVNDMGDGRSYATEELGDRVRDRPAEETVKPHPGELWENKRGEQVFVGRRATVVDGGWYVTVVRTGFEYVVDHDGKLAGWSATGELSSTYDLVRRIH